MGAQEYCTSAPSQTQSLQGLQANGCIRCTSLIEKYIYCIIGGKHPYKHDPQPRIGKVELVRTPCT